MNVSMIISYIANFINTLLIKCKVKNFMDINRLISTEKSVEVCLES